MYLDTMLLDYLGSYVHSGRQAARSPDILKVNKAAELGPNRLQLPLPILTHKVQDADAGHGEIRRTKCLRVPDHHSIVGNGMRSGDHERDLGLGFLAGHKGLLGRKCDSSKRQAGEGIDAVGDVGEAHCEK